MTLIGFKRIYIYIYISYNASATATPNAGLTAREYMPTPYLDLFQSVPLHSVVQEVMQRHAQGIHFREMHTDTCDADMQDQGRIEVARDL